MAGGFLSLLRMWLGRAGGPVVPDVPAVVVSRIHVRSAIGASDVGIKPAITSRGGAVRSAVSASACSLKPAVVCSAASVKSAVIATKIKFTAGGD